MELINKTGKSSLCYNFISFKGTNGTWKLIGTESTEDSNSSNVIDEFTDGKGNYKKVMRSLVYSLACSGKIQPSLSYPVIGPSEYNSRAKKRLI